MRRYRKILVPIDGTSASEHALSEACSIARRHESRVEALMLHLLRQERETVAQYAPRIVEIAREAGVEADIVYQSGRPSDAVLDTAGREGNDLIVIGTAHMHGLDRLVMGSFTSRVIGHSGADILVVPEGARLGYRRVLLCADGSAASEAAIEQAMDYARAEGGTLTVVAVAEVNEEFSSESPDGAEKLVRKAKAIAEALSDKARQFGVTAEALVREGTAHEKILELAGQIGVESIFMGSHGRRGLSSLIMGSVAKKVAVDSGCAVFVLKPEHHEAQAGLAPAGA